MEVDEEQIWLKKSRRWLPLPLPPTPTPYPLPLPPTWLKISTRWPPVCMRLSSLSSSSTLPELGVGSK